MKLPAQRFLTGLDGNVFRKMLEIIPEKTLPELNPEKREPLFCLQNCILEVFYFHRLTQYSRQSEYRGNLPGNNSRIYFRSIIEGIPEFTGDRYCIVAFILQKIKSTGKKIYVSFAVQIYELYKEQGYVFWVYLY